MTASPIVNLSKLPTGITGFDVIGHGGVPRGRCCVVAGTAGVGKTILGLQFIARGLSEYDEPGVIVTFEELPADLLGNVRSFGWNLDEALQQKRLTFVDASPEPGESLVPAGAFDLSALLARIENGIRKVGAKRVILDSIGALFPQLSDAGTVRRELHRIVAGLRHLGMTTIMTLERTEEDGPVGRFGVEEFVADNVVVLRNRLVAEKRRRTIEILKFRGSEHQKGEHPYTIDPSEGITILPLSSTALQQKSSDARVSSGVPELDTMCGGGMYRDSIILTSGATGTGKTLTVAHFVDAAIKAGERVLLFASEESREQLTRNAQMWGVDFEAAIRSGLLRIISRYPEVMGLEDHLLHIRREIIEFGPARVAVDSISAFERVATPTSFREFIIGLTSWVKQQEITGLFTNTTSIVTGGDSITETHFSTITDTIILLRYVELFGQMHRGLTVLKMRGTWHEKEIREYTIDNRGMHIGKPFRGVHGILSGSPSYTFVQERERMDEMFNPPASGTAGGRGT